MITIPSTIKTDSDRVRFLYRVIELLRLEHNIWGKNFREGKLTEKEFRDYQKYNFEPRSQILFAVLNPIKEKLGMFQLDLKNTTDPRLFYEEEGKAIIIWDNKIDIAKI